MVTVEVVDKNGRVIEHRRFRFYATAAEWYERAKITYQSGINMRFGDQKPVSPE